MVDASFGGAAAAKTHDYKNCTLDFKDIRNDITTQNEIVNIVNPCTSFWSPVESPWRLSFNHTFLHCRAHVFIVNNICCPGS